MSDRISGLVCVLEDDARDKDLEPLITAISCLRGVLEVRAITSRPGLEQVLKRRIRNELKATVIEALDKAAYERDEPEE
jgi:hypothetical protein